MEPTKLMIDLVSAFGPIGFVFWLVWRTTSHTVPRMAQKFEDAIEKQRQDFKETLQLYQQHEREVHEREVNRLCEAVDALAEKMVTPETAVKSLVEAMIELKRMTKEEPDE